MDDPELELSSVRPQSPAGPHHRRLVPDAVLARGWRIALAVLSLLLALLVILRVWLPLSHTSSLPHTSLPTTLMYSSPTPRPTATAVLAPTPLPVSELLATPPTHCPAAPHLHTISVPAFDGFIGSTVQMTGLGSVWVPDVYLPERVVTLDQPTSAPSWPSTLIMWEIGPIAHPTVTVRAVDMDTGELAWWALEGDTPQVPVLVMNPSLDFPTGESWIPYRTLLLITHAGCYELDVSWTGGAWRTIFAAGRTST